VVLTKKLDGQMQAEPHSEAVYRPDIDGLRAVAVIAVVLYHAGVPGVTGGFIGVDVFFVISGFLITSQLASSRETGVFSLLTDFYARRSRRILPALTVVASVTVILSWLFLLPDGEQQDFAKSAIASALFVSNLFFWQFKNDYFAGPAELQPLLHTWSLSVEEQFYLFWPLLLLIIWAIERKGRLRVNVLVGVFVVVVSGLSFALSVRWAETNPIAAFFLTPSRVWELGTGATLALLLGVNVHRKLPGPFGFIGLSCIVLAAVLYSPQTPFPGLAAALPVAGTAFIIMAGRHHLVYRILASPPMLATGKISYAWYLWHWPLLTIARVNDLGHRNLGRDSALVVLAYGLAYLSTRYIETPIRQKRFAPFLTARASLSSGLILILISVASPTGLWIAARSEFRTTYAPLKSQTTVCLDPFLNNKVEPSAPCVLARGAAGSVFLIGDSHGDQWSPAVAEWARGADIYAIDRSIINCDLVLTPEANEDPIPSSTFRFRPDCVTFSKLILNEIHTAVSNNKPVGVVLDQYWSLVRYGAGDIFLQKLESRIKLLVRMGVRVLIIGPNPIFPFDVPSCVARRGEELCRLPREQHEAFTEGVNKVLQLVAAERSNVELWNPTSQFCDDSWCYPMRGGSLLYWDDNHVSRTGAERAEPELASHLNWLVKRDQLSIKNLSGSSP
jgi:peptidoglycan/LPS O-acetylase OafA/YrhL